MNGHLIAIGMMLSIALSVDRPVIQSPADLPATSFQLDTLPSEALNPQTLNAETLQRIKAEAERIRVDYDIADQALARSLREGLAAIAVLQHRAADASRLIAESRATSNKPQQKAVEMMLLEAATAIVDGPVVGRCDRGAKRISALLNAADSAIVRDDVLQQRAGLEAVGDAFVVGVVKAQLDPAASANGKRIDLSDALTLAYWRVRLEILQPCRVELSDVIQRWAADPRRRPVDIWAAREPALNSFQKANPVVVAVWDSGIDQTIFPGQLAVDPQEPIDGVDNDGNGIVDDWNGPTFDARMRPDPSPLKRPSPLLADQIAFQTALYKGSLDLQFGIDTVDARLFAIRGREAPVADQTTDDILWNEIRFRSHGTAVASEIADGNSFVRLLSVSAQPWGRDPDEVVTDEALNDRWVAAVDRLAAKFHSANVRIVNMSWGYTVDEVANKLLRYGGVTDKAQATKRAKAMWSKADAAMRRLLATCPDILFVNAAGNSDQSDEILASTPQVTAAPNLLIVGATGSNGLPTSFTTYGKGVAIYALGEAVPLRTIGGMRMRMSGTSMAAPLVARTAAQMLAVNPRLTPRQLIEGLLTKATTSESSSLKLLHSSASVAWARDN